MPDPLDERMDALSEAIRRMLARQQEFERRLARIERALHIKVASWPAPAVPPSEATPEPQPAPPPAEPQPAPLNEAPPAPPPEVPEAPRSRFEVRLGLTLINRLGVVTLVLGVAFFFKYAVDNRWIGESGRVSLGVLAGLLTLGLADRFWRRGETAFAQGISGAGIAILYVSFYAAFGFYSLIPYALAFALMALNTAAAGALALRYSSAAIAALGLAGGYATPLLLSSGANRPWGLFTYVLLLDLGAMALARARNWRGIEALAFAGTSMLWWSWFIGFDRSHPSVAEIFAVVFYALFAISRSRVVSASAQAMALVELVTASWPNPLPFLPLAALVSAAGLAVAERRGRPEAPLVSFFSFWAPLAVALSEFRAHGGAETIFFFLTLLFLLFFAWTPWRILVRKAPVTGADLALVVLNAAFFYGAGYTLLEKEYHAWMGLFAVALAGLHFSLAREMRSGSQDARPVRLYTGVALALVTLAIPIQFAGYRIAMAWALEACGLAWIGVRTGERRLTLASLAVFALTLARLLAIDSWIYPNAQEYTALWNPRFLTFLTAAAALWLTAWFVRTGVPALAPYVTGHFALLWALALEVLGWAARNTAPPDLENVRSTAMSILLAAYAVLLVAIGVGRRSPLDRALGLGLIAVVVVKLYVYDVWRLSRGMYRVAAFAALGIFLLITSYLYSRYRGSIESWWRDEKTDR